jgi:hypothetical protein
LVPAKPDRPLPFASFVPVGVATPKGFKLSSRGQGHAFVPVAHGRRPPWILPTLKGSTRRFWPVRARSPRRPTRNLLLRAKEKQMSRDPRCRLEQSLPAEIGTPVPITAESSSVLGHPHPPLRGSPSPKGRGLFSPRIPALSPWPKGEVCFPQGFRPSPRGPKGDGCFP